MSVVQATTRVYYPHARASHALACRFGCTRRRWAATYDHLLLARRLQACARASKRAQNATNDVRVVFEDDKKVRKRESGQI